MATNQANLINLLWNERWDSYLSNDYKINWFGSMAAKVDKNWINVLNIFKNEINWVYLWLQTCKML